MASVGVLDGDSYRILLCVRLDRPLFNIGGPDDLVHTPYASFRRASIEPVRTHESSYPTSLGSRVGVVYAFKQQSIRLHCILNGHDYGPLAILRFGDPVQPVRKRQRTCGTLVNEQVKLWAFVDVYGATKSVRIIQLYGGQ